MQTDMSPALTPGQSLARGTCRLLRGMDFATLTEVPLACGLRVDVMAIGPRGEIWIVECKSSRSDFQSDRKWMGYTDWCDAFFWAVDPDFDTDLLPKESGLILADPYEGEIARLPAPTPLSGARRRSLNLRFARMAASRLQSLLDPTASLPKV